MLSQFEKYITTNLPFLRGHKLLIACSGGLDSMVLVALCQKAGLTIALAHCNFKLRGNESDIDAQFVDEMAANYNIRAYSKEFSTIDEADERGISIQMAARELRYAWFQELCSNEGYDYVLTAHHADDSLETFLINLTRGTGLEGLKGIPEINGNIVRPLLSFSRKEILKYGQEEGLTWREDSSNAETKYLRNKIRHELVPHLKALDPSFLRNFLKTQDFLQESSQVLESTQLQLQTTLFETKDDLIKMPIDKLKRLNPLKPYLHLLFKEFGFTEWNDVTALLDATSGKEVRSSTHRLVKDRNHLLLSELTFEANQIHHIAEYISKIKIPIAIDIQKVKQLKTTSKKILYVDNEKLNYPLTLRKWENGDYFYPLGMQGKKKLSKFFKDEKIDILSKQTQWLLCSNNKIVWVVGKRADERFKVTAKTKQIVKFELI